MADFPHEQWARTMAVNVAAIFTLTRELLPLLDAAATKADPARVVNIGSVMGTLPVAEGAYAYTASKGAVHHLTKTLAGELAARHITVNAFAPGPFPSKMTAFATGTQEGAAKVGANVPLGRIGNAEDIAAATLYLCGRGGAYVSGAILPLDGGMSVETHVNLFANLWAWCWLPARRRGWARASRGPLRPKAPSWCWATLTPGRWRLWRLNWVWIASPWSAMCPTPPMPGHWSSWRWSASGALILR
jgi:hypothetical protein